MAGRLLGARAILQLVTLGGMLALQPDLVRPALDCSGESAQERPSLTAQLAAK